MRSVRRIDRWLALFVLIVRAFFIHAAEDAPKPDADPEKLIQVLENGDFDERQAAIKKLEAMGARARTALEKAAKDSDSLDVRQTADRLLEALTHCRLVIEAVDRKGRPLPNIDAEVTCYSFAYNPTIQNLNQTDAQGRIVVDKLIPGPHYFYIGWKNLHTIGAVPQGTCFLKPGENRFIYELSKGGEVKGRVITAGNQPVQNANVLLLRSLGAIDPDMTLNDLLRMAEYLEQTQTQTDETGQFTIEDVLPGSYTVFAYSETHQHAFGGTLNVNEEETVTLEAPIKLAPKSQRYGTIKVKLLDNAGAPIKDGNLTMTLQPIFKGPDAEKSREAWLTRLRQSLYRGSNFEESTSDEGGVVEIKDVPAGKFTLHLASEHPDGNSDREYYFPEVTVKAGETTQLPDSRPGAGVKVTGRILGSDGQAIDNLSIKIFRENDLVLPLILTDPMFANSFFGSGAHFESSSITFEDEGRFQIPNLAHGTYTFCISQNDKLLGVMHGIKSEGTEPLQLKDFKLKQIGTNLQPIHGMLYLPDGKPAANLRVTLIHNNGTSTFNSANDGSITMNSDDYGAAQVVVIVEGFCPVNLETAQLNGKRIDIRLVAQQFGNVDVAVVGQDGKPLPGATVSPAIQPYGYGNNESRVRFTDRNGHASLKRLAYGQRELLVFLDGYYLPKPVEFELNQAEKQISVTMNRGVTVKGTLQVPGDRKAEGVLLSLRYGKNGATGFNRSNVFATTDAKGAFSFDGLAPGKVYISVYSSGHTLDIDGPLTIAENMAPLQLKLVPTTSVTLDFGPEAAGFNATVQAPGAWRIENSSNDELLRATMFCDSAGKATFKSIRPGTYDVTLSRATDIEWDSPNTSATSSVLFKGIKVTGETNQAIKLKSPETTGKLSAHVSLKGAHDWNPQDHSVTSLALEMISDHGVALITFSLPESLNNEYLPAVFGKPTVPIDFRDPASVVIPHLPPGEYALTAWVSENNGNELVQNSLSPTPLRKISVKSGETTSLGELEVSIPPDVLAKVRDAFQKQQHANLKSYMEQIGREDGPGFQP